MQLPKLVTGPWTLEQLNNGSIGTPKNGLKVFSCFHCGGGSTMGYKLAGFDVLGGVEIDPEMMGIYRSNHNPKYSYLMGVQEFNKIPNEELPSELFDLDVLDGSPPCSSFSMAGSREKTWGKEKKFREGQAVQVLDDLFFHFIETAKKLRPKVVVSENVKGLIIGNTRGYVKQIFKSFREAGYETQLFLLNASRMGVPQKRERTFFISRRIDLSFNKISFDFNEEVIPTKKAFIGSKENGKPLTPLFKKYWSQIKPGCGLGKINKFNQWKKINPDLVSFTQTSTIRLMHFSEPRLLSDHEVLRLQTFPEDFNFNNQDVGYVCGMSVPPLMMQRVAISIAKQFFKSPSIGY